MLIFLAVVGLVGGVLILALAVRQMCGGGLCGWLCGQATWQAGCQAVGAAVAILAGSSSD